MAGVPFKIETKVTTPSGQQFDYTQTITSGDGDIVEDVQVAASATQLLVCAFDNTKVKAYEITADHACTIKADSTSSPSSPAIPMVAGVPVWFTPGLVSLFTAPVTVGLYVINTAGAVVNLHAEIFLDTTP